jgi:hypothetical protein
MVKCGMIFWLFTGKSSFLSFNSTQFLYFWNFFFFRGQEPKRLKSMLGFSFVRQHSKVTDYFQNLPSGVHLRATLEMLAVSLQST